MTRFQEHGMWFAFKGKMNRRQVGFVAHWSTLGSGEKMTERNRNRGSRNEMLVTIGEVGQEVISSHDYD